MNLALCLALALAAAAGLLLAVLAFLRLHGRRRRTDFDETALFFRRYLPVRAAGGQEARGPEAPPPSTLQNG